VLNPEFNDAMRAALDLAAKASQQGDVPVGAIVMNSDGEVVGRGFNTREIDNDPMNHAESCDARSCFSKWFMAAR
jgi:tRNA(adenine34) deaminase